MSSLLERIVRPAGTAALAATLLAALTGAARAGELTVTAVAPASHFTAAPASTSISVTFDRPVDGATLDGSSFRVFGRWSGAQPGPITVSTDGLTATLDPVGSFSAGERVTVVLSHDIAAVDGSPMRSAGYAWQFWVRARPATLDYAHVTTMTTRTIPTQTSRAYGGIGSDLNGDGHLDITVVNEDTADLRVFLNLGDGTGQLAPFIQPTFPVGDRASPSEPADFDNDGNVDICVTNINANTVSVLLGAGDGTFGPQQLITVGSAPRGIAVLDADGDGDMDIANTNSASGNCSILLNDGRGTFGAPEFFEGGGSGEWALDAADMDGDGIFDLIIGARNSGHIIIQRGNGDGTFSFASSQSAGGSTWMIATGDLNGDGFADVSSANSTSNNGAILLGDGRGGLAAPATYPTDSFPLATDVGDVDGDGDLDWITSSFGGDWFLFVNDGDGTFAFDQELPAPSAASCAVILDMNGDGDNDLVLIDEIADVIIVYDNGDTVPGDVDGDGVVDVDDLLELLASWGPCGICAADLDLDGDVDVDDLLELLGAWSL